MSRLGSSAYARLPTERANPATRRIDRLPTREVVRLLHREDARVAPAVAREAASTARAAEAAARALARGGRLWLFGAGTSGRLAVMEAAECPPTFGVLPSRVRAVMAGGPRAVFRAREGAEDDAGAGRRAGSRVRPPDVAIGVAASGVTPFVRAALAAARSRGCRTVLITSNGRPPAGAAEIVIAPRVGPEALAGSTRLKSATAAKLALNAVTTAAMIRLGKVYEHWMVDLRLTSRKLRLRALRLVERLGRVDARGAAALLGEARGSVKLAVLMARRRLPSRRAAALLREAGGDLRRALGER